MKNYIITIARGFGSGGKTIGNMLSKELSIPCYEDQILKMASDYSGLNVSLFNKVDEKLSGPYMTKILKGMPTTKVTMQAHEDKFVSNINLFNIQAEIIKKLAETESCIIIGKCANNILKNYDNVISVYLEAPRSECVKRIVDRLGLSEEEAERMIINTDKYRAKYYKYYSRGESWTNPTAYDMTLNTARVTPEYCTKIISDYVKMCFEDL